MRALKVIPLTLSAILIGGILVSCGVDPRWGPSKWGLRENPSRQYEPEQTARPVATMVTAPAFQGPQMAPPQRVSPQRALTQVRPRKVRLVGGRAIAPAHAPEVVKRAVAAGNRMQRFPYKFGGGHARLNDDGYDCSGSVSYVLREAGIMSDQMISSGFLNFGQGGTGDWITVWAKKGHVFLTVGGLRFDTGGSPKSNGPRWKDRKRSRSGFVPRHPPGL